MKTIVASILALLVLAVCGSSLAAIAPQPGPGDPRIRVVHYDPDQVIELQATVGYQMSVEFGSGERIENVSVGDSLGWQLTPNHKADLLFIKPLDAHTVTDMTVVTNLRRYVFALSARRPAKHDDALNRPHRHRRRRRRPTSITPIASSVPRTARRCGFSTTDIRPISPSPRPRNIRPSSPSIRTKRRLW